MKILPDYIIEYMPDLEEAIEELRLSVLDHAYDLLKCLDVDELSSDDIRHKLELYDIKVENMSEAWLPNNRFYRMYPEIRHNRTRYNAIKSIVHSGGQFEGVWSTGFSNKSEYNFRNIQILRHYSLGSDLDGYFYVSGNPSLANGIIGSSALQALQTDILMNQALPAGYTYLYVPWPRPSYPNDVDYMYNVHMLDFDRLYNSSLTYHIRLDSYNDKLKTIKTMRDIFGYGLKEAQSLANSVPSIITTKPVSEQVAKDIKLTFDDLGDSVTLIETLIELDDSVPASTYYHWNTGKDTPYRTPYWFDYHYINPYNKDLWPMAEHGTYTLRDGSQVSRIDQSVASSDVVEYELDATCSILSDSSLYSMTACYDYMRLTMTNPSRHQLYTPLNEDGYYNTSDMNYDTSMPLSDGEPGEYRFDYLNKFYTIHSEQVTSNIREFKPIWCETIPPFSTISSEPFSLRDWFTYNLANTETVNNKSLLDDDSIISNNKPKVSVVTHTSPHQPSIRSIPNQYVLYTKPVGSQGTNSSTSNQLRFYTLNSNVEETYDFSKAYNITHLGYIALDGTQSIVENTYGARFTSKISSTDNKLEILNASLQDINYVLYTVSSIKNAIVLWVDPNNPGPLYSDQQLSSRCDFTPVVSTNYNSRSVSYLKYNVLDMYSSDGSIVYDDTASVITKASDDNTSAILVLRAKPETMASSIARILVQFDKIEYDITYIAYSRSSAYQNSNQSLSNTAYATLYEPGDVGVLAGDTTKDYEITGMWNAAGSPINFNGIGLSCYLYSGNPRIRIRNDQLSSVTWNRIEYKVHDRFRVYLNSTNTDVNFDGTDHICYGRNGLQSYQRTAGEVYTIIGVYTSNGTLVNTGFNNMTITAGTTATSNFVLHCDVTEDFGYITIAYVEFTVSNS